MYFDHLQQSHEALQKVVSGRYVVESLYDKGGVAELYLATPTAPQSPQVVIKILRPFMALDEDLAAMFRDEIVLFQTLDHPHVVRYLEGNTRSRPAYLVMEYVEGCNLARFHEWLQEQPAPPSWSIAATIAAGLIEGLHYLHEAKDQQGQGLGLIHRDLTPPNVLLGLNGAVKLTDFGISIYRNMSRSTQGKDPKGRFSYLAPEMLRGVAIDQRADIFSWGVIIWELLTGQRLFQSTNPEQTLQQVGSAPILPPSALQSDVPAALEAIVMKALTRDREQRYPHMSALKEHWDALPLSWNQSDLTQMLRDSLKN